MSNKLGLISDRVINISDTVKASLVNGKWAIYNDGVIGDYEYDNVIMICPSLVALPTSGNSKIKVIKDDCTEVFSGVPTDADIENFGSTWNTGLHLGGNEYIHVMAKYIKENCSPRELITAKKMPRNKRNTSYRASYDIKLTYSLDGDMMIFKLSTSWVDSYIVANYSTMEWEENFCGSLIDITKAENGIRRVKYASSNGRDESFLTDTIGRKIVGPIKGEISKFCGSKTVYQITRKFAKESANYGVNGEEIQTGLFELTEDRGEYKLTALLEDTDCALRNVTDTMVLIRHNRRYEIIGADTKNVLGDGVSLVWAEIVGTLQKDVAGRFDLDGTLFIYSTRLRELRKIKNAAKIARVAFDVLKITYNDGSVEYYKNGRYETSMVLAYIEAKPLYTPMCKEKMYGGMTSNGDWYPTNAEGVPLEKDPYDSFKELQEKYRNKIGIPKVYRMCESLVC